MKEGKVAVAPQALGVGGKKGKKGGDWGKGSDLAEGVSAMSKAGSMVDMYSPDEAKKPYAERPRPHLT